MPEVALVMSAGYAYPLRELAETLQYELEQQAVPSTLHIGAFPEPRPSLVHILLDPEAYVANEGQEALPDDRLLRRTIFLCAEPLPAVEDDHRATLLRRAGAVFSLDQPSVMAMHRVGIRARLLKPGYSKFLDRFDPAAPRLIDVMFLGTHSLRLTKYLSRAAPVLARHNCLLQIAEGTPSPRGTASFLADARWPLLARTKVVISLHREDESRLDWRGSLDAIHAGAVVVAEHCSGLGLLVPGEHLLVASADALPYVVEDLLEDEERLSRLRSRAYERLKSWIPYALSVAVLRAAIVELVGEPVVSGSALGASRSSPSVADVALSDAMHDGPRTAARRLRAGRVALARENPAWRSRRAPLVTSVVAGSGRSEQIIPTLDSLARSRLRDFELVVVVGTVDGDEARGTVENWMSDHPRIPAQLVLAELNGVGAARNVGLDFARGTFLLILAPGQELYPRCLEVLAGTLDAMPEMAFVYPIQEVTGAPEEFVEAGGDYLESFFGWNPARLRARNDIHAPALMRTDRLRRVGGFAPDPSLAGFEDYDLWCRMTEQGWRGQLVPQTLARRPESAASAMLGVPQP